jgi:hypothetical protein
MTVKAQFSCCDETTVRLKRPPRLSPFDWDGSYGTSRGKAHISVKHTTCPSCGQKPGELCKFKFGVAWTTHADRRELYREQKRSTRTPKPKPRWRMCTLATGCSQ